MRLSTSLALLCACAAVGVWCSSAVPGTKDDDEVGCFCFSLPTPLFAAGLLLSAIALCGTSSLALAHSHRLAHSLTPTLSGDALQLRQECTGLRLSSQPRLFPLTNHSPPLAELHTWTQYHAPSPTPHLLHGVRVLSANTRVHLLSQLHAFHEIAQTRGLPYVLCERSALNAAKRHGLNAWHDDVSVCVAETPDSGVAEELHKRGFGTRVQRYKDETHLLISSAGSWPSVRVKPCTGMCRKLGLLSMPRWPNLVDGQVLWTARTPTEYLNRLYGRHWQEQCEAGTGAPCVRLKPHLPLVQRLVFSREPTRWNAWPPGTRVKSAPWEVVDTPVLVAVLDTAFRIGGVRAQDVDWSEVMEEVQEVRAETLRGVAGDVHTVVSGLVHTQKTCHFLILVHPSISPPRMEPLFVQCKAKED